MSKAVARDSSAVARRHVLKGLLAASMLAGAAAPVIACAVDPLVGLCADYHHLRNTFPADASDEAQEEWNDRLCEKEAEIVARLPVTKEGALALLGVVHADLSAGGPEDDAVVMLAAALCFLSRAE